MNNNYKDTIPVFFATDNNYVPYLSVALSSMLDNASKEYFYKVYILTTSISEENSILITGLSTENSTIEFISLKDELDKVQDKLCMRDYYSKETYYRFFIADLFPEYKKVLYLDCDIAVPGDISKLYNEDLGDCYVGAVHDEVIDDIPEFCDYVELCCDVPVKQYFNAGILVINTEKFRSEKVEEQFVKLLNEYTFEVAQDQDYLNIICKDKVKYLNLGWNKTAFENPDFDDADLGIVHFKMNWKPWHFENVHYEEIFWKYADVSPYAEVIRNSLETYSEENRKRDMEAGKRLLYMAYEEAINPDNYRNRMIRKHFVGKVKENLRSLRESLGLDSLFNKFGTRA